MIEIKRDTIIGDILDVAPQTAPIFLSMRRWKRPAWSTESTWRSCWLS